MIAGFSSPDSGEIRIGGKPMNGVAPNQRPVNMVFQHLALFPMMSVGENIAYGLARRGMAREDIKRRVGAMLERVSLAGAQDKRIDQLSGGQKQRVAIARSLVLEPTLLLLDEPLGALDLKLREHMKIELKQLQAAFGTTFVYITHDQSEALVMSDHVAVMNHGRFEQLGRPQELYYQPQTAFVAGFVGAANRIAGRVTRVDAQTVAVTSEQGLEVFARASAPRTAAVVPAAGGRDGTANTAPAEAALRVGDAAEVFVRPEVIILSRLEDNLLAAGFPRYSARVESLLFDGANSAVLVREERAGVEFRIALPQTGQFADLSIGERIFFSFDPQRAVCFASADGERG